MIDAARVLEEALSLTPEERVRLALKVIESFGDLDDEARDNIPFGELRVAIVDAMRPDMSRAEDPRLRALWVENRWRLL